MQTGFWWGNMKKRDHLEDLGTDGILKWTLNKELDAMDWIHLVQDRTSGQDLVETIMSLQCPQNVQNLTSRGTISFSRTTQLCGLTE